MRKLILIAVIGLTASVSFARELVDVVLDLDGVIVFSAPFLSSIEKKSNLINIDVNGTLYSVHPLAIQLINALEAYEFNGYSFRVSAFSGGISTRNLPILDQIHLNQEQTFGSMLYKILSHGDLIDNKFNGEKEIPSIEFPFVYTRDRRFIKSLKLITENLDRVILVDNTPRFAAKGEEPNLLIFRNGFDARRNQIASEYERVLGLLIEALQQLATKGISVRQTLIANQYVSIEGSFKPTIVNDDRLRELGRDALNQPMSHCLRLIKNGMALEHVN